MIPRKIRLQNQGTLLVLEYEGEVTAELDAEFLRVLSPSAEVQGHGGVGGQLPTGKLDVSIKKIEPVGHYAIKLIFDDGHDSGLYTWAYLAQLYTEKAERWERYLAELKTRGLSREEGIQVVRLLD